MKSLDFLNMICIWHEFLSYSLQKFINFHKKFEIFMEKYPNKIHL